MQLIGRYLREDDKPKFEELCGLPGIIAGQTAVTINTIEFAKLKHFPFGDTHRASLHEPMVSGAMIYGRNQAGFVALYPNERLRLEDDPDRESECPFDSKHVGSLKLAEKPRKHVAQTGCHWVVPYSVFQLLSNFLSVEPIPVEYQGRELSDITGFSIKEVCDETCTPIVPPSTISCRYCGKPGKSISDLFQLEQFPSSEAVAFAAEFGHHRKLSPIIVSNDVSDEINLLCSGQSPFGSVFEQDDLPEEVRLLKELYRFLFSNKK